MEAILRLNLHPLIFTGVDFEFYLIKPILSLFFAVNQNS
jgi:hypothetical protein